MYGKRTVGFFSLASPALRASEARAVCAHKTPKPRVTDFFTDFEKKPTVLQSSSDTTLTNKFDFAETVCSLIDHR